MFKYTDNIFYNKTITIKEDFYFSSSSEPYLNEICTYNFNDFEYIKNELIKLNIQPITFLQVTDCIKLFYDNEGNEFVSQIDFIYFRNENNLILKIININSKNNQKKYGFIFRNFFIKEFKFLTKKILKHIF